MWIVGDLRSSSQESHWSNLTPVTHTLKGSQKCIGKCFEKSDLCLFCRVLALKPNLSLMFSRCPWVWQDRIWRGRDWCGEFGVCPWNVETVGAMNVWRRIRVQPARCSPRCVSASESPRVYPKGSLLMAASGSVTFPVASQHVGLFSWDEIGKLQPEPPKAPKWKDFSWVQL